MSDLFFRNRRLLVLSLLLIVVSGLSAYTLLPRREDPSLSQRWSTVMTMYPGASAERIEALVTEKIEEELRDLEEIKVIDSISRPGASVVNIELKDEIVDISTVWSKVRDRLGDVAPSLPKKASIPHLEDDSQGAMTFLVGLTWDGEGETPLAVIRRLGEELEDLMRANSGAVFVKVYGAPKEEVLVEFTATNLASYGLTPGEVSRAIAQTDAKVTAGLFRSPGTNLTIEVEGELCAIESIRRIPLRRGDDGQVVRVGDIAKVTKSLVDPPRQLALLDGKRGIAVGVRMGAKHRVDKWVVGLRSELEPFAKSLPPGIRYEVLFDQSGYTKGRLDQLLRNLMLGAVFVVLVMFVMMGWRSAILVGLSLPLSSMMVLTGMWFFGIPIHQMSITGLILSLGLLIDNAIIVVDEVGNRLRSGEKPVEAVGRSVRYLAIPLLGSTVTTILAFLPIALLPGGAGEFVGAIALSVMLALTSSFALAMTIVPTLTGMFGLSRTRGGFWREGFHSEVMVTAYRRFLDALLAWPKLTVGAVTTVAFLGFMRQGDLVEQFFPPADRDQFHIEMRLPTQAGIALSVEQSEIARKLIREHAEVTGVSWFMGTSAPQVYYNMVGNETGAANYAHGIVSLSSSEHTMRVIRELQLELERALPETIIVVRQFEQGPPFNAPVELRIFGPDAFVLRDLGDRARKILSEVPDVTVVRTTLSMGTPQLTLKVDDEEMRRGGLDNVTVASELDGALEGQVGGTIIEGSEELDVRVRLSNLERGDIRYLRSSNIAREAGDGRLGWLPLSALGDFDLEPEIGRITRRGCQRVNIVRGNITAGVLPAKVLGDFEERMVAQHFEVPAGYWYQFGGEQAERDNSVGNLMASVGLIVTMMGTILVLTFKSFRIAILICLIGILAIGMGLFALWVFGFPFGFMAIVGTMGLVGIAINDTIVVLAALDASPLAKGGDPEAIREVVVHSSRHVLATTITTMAGFAPLVFGGGGTWPPLAISISGGVLGATLMALTLVPAAYLILHQKMARA